MRALLLTTVAAAGAACASPSDDVVGPFTGPVHRYVVDRIDVPRDSAQATAFAADLDGDGDADNQLGVVAIVLATINDLSTHGPDMIASGALASTVLLQAEDPTDAARAGVTYLGADGDPATPAGGRLVAGAFRSNRVATTRAPGRAVVRLPIYVNADPLALELAAFELDLAPDGAGGFDGVVRGAMTPEVAREAAYLGLIQMIDTEPERHLVFARTLDTDRDGTITRAEVDDSIIAILLAPDLELGGRPMISVAFGIHLAPCDDGRCITATPADGCRDRARGGDETDVDCGGACQPCATGKRCAGPADCQSAACDAGACRAPTCTDGVRDGYESDVDCGGACGPCAAGQACAADEDCADGACDNDVASLGTCTPP